MTQREERQVCEEREALANIRDIVMLQHQVFQFVQHVQPVADGWANVTPTQIQVCYSKQAVCNVSFVIFLIITFVVSPPITNHVKGNTSQPRRVLKFPALLN